MNRPIEAEDANFDYVLAEKVLAEKLENVTEAIKTSPGYEVSLEGVQPERPIVWGALETYFDTLLDTANGATITLDYNIATDRLVLKEICAQTHSQGGPVFIRRTQDGDYIPIQTIDNAEIHFGSDSLLGGLGVRTNDAIKPQFGDAILEAFGIQDIPHNSEIAYQIWLSSALGASKAWRLTESAEFPIAFTETSSQSLTIKKETVVGDSMEDFFISRSLTERINQFIPGDSMQLINESTLELSGDIGPTPLRHHLTEYAFTPDPFVLNHGERSDEKSFVCAIDESSYSRFKKKLEETQLLKHQQSQLDN